MAAGSAAASRMAKEIRMLQAEPPPGVWAAPRGDSLTELEAQIQGPRDTVYEGGLFRLAVDIPTRYPFEPPKVRFKTPVYHPNIDPEGRICLDTLNMPPKGVWKPSLNVATVLASLGLLLAEPNPEDGLVTDITAEFRHQRALFDSKARQWTRRYAMGQGDAGDAGAGAAEASGAGKDGAGAAPAAPEQQQQQQQQQGEQLAAAAGGAGGSKENRQPGIGGEGSCKQQAAAAEGAAAAGGGGGVPAQEQPAKRPRLALRK